MSVVPPASTAPPPVNILVMNAGSSSQKSCLFRIDGTALPDNPPTPLWSGKIEWNAPGGASLTTTVASETTHAILAENTARQGGVSQMLETLWNGDRAVLGGPREIAVVGHRVVHGGQDLWQPTRVTPAVKQTIQQLTPLAPEHNPAAREGMEIIDQLLGPEAFQVAVFDTGFHRTIPESATTYPGPYSWVNEGIRRYGFHGINHAWCAERASRLLSDHDATTRRLICCHLGNGCSLAAIRGGTCIDTTMGFTPMEGLMMGSRSGSVDPGILLYLLEQPGGLSPADLGRILNEESGLKGLSGVSGDLRAVVTAINTGNERARLAWDVYIHRLRWHIGAMVASLGGLDALVFTAGIGENSAAVRSDTCASFGFLGLSLDETKNEKTPENFSNPERNIASSDSRVRVLVIPANEDWAIARHSYRLLSSI